MKLLTNKFFILGNLFLILIAIPITLFFIGKQQETRSRAAASTVLYFNPPTPNTTTACTSFTADVMVDPGQNVVSIVDMYLTYDATKLSIDSIIPSAAFPETIRTASISNGSANISVSVGGDTAKAVRTAGTKVATITFKPIAATSGTTSVVFDRTSTSHTRAFSLSGADQPTEDVIQTVTPANITIKQDTTCPNGTTSGTPSTNKAPVCSSLVLDRSATGAAPYSITFTAAGNDTDGTITKAAFSFGDGKTGEVTTSNGIGTNTINAPISHTFQNAGTYNVTATITDNQNATSATTTCTATVTVTAGTTTTGGGTTTTTTGTNAAPVCTDFTVTPATGSAPLTTLLTAKGNDPDGLITKTTFNFGDGQIQDVTAGMNTQSVSPQTNHTYTTSGNFNATVTFTDNKSGVSTICAKTVTVSGTSTSEPAATAVPTIAQPGASATTIGAIGGIILTILGGILLLTL